jgi:hypothetical protein
MAFDINIGEAKKYLLRFYVPAFLSLAFIFSGQKFTAYIIDFLFFHMQPAPAAELM